MTVTDKVQLTVNGSQVATTDRIMRKLLLITSLLFAAGLVSAVYWSEDAEADGIRKVAATPYLLEKVKADEWLLIDVRSPQEYAEGHIPGAINMPHEQIDDYVEQLSDARDKPIIIYCRSGRRASIAMQMLEAEAFTDINHLEGDMLGWTAAGLPVNKLAM